MQAHPDPDKAVGIREQMDEISLMIEKLNARQKSGNKVIVFAASMFLTTSIAYTLFQFSDVNTILSATTPSPFRLFPYSFARRLICQLSHYDMLPIDFASEDAYMIRETHFPSTRSRNLRFCVPIGLAAGIDVNCDGPAGLLKLGFGSIEVGTVTLAPSAAVDEANVSLVDNSIISSIDRSDGSKGLAEVSDNLCTYIEHDRPDDMLTRNTVCGVSVKINSPDDVETIFKNDRLIENADYIALDVSHLTSIDSVSKIIAKVDTVSAPSLPGIYLKMGLAQSFPPNPQIVREINNSSNIAGVSIRGSGIARVGEKDMNVSGAVSKGKSTEAVSAWYKALSKDKEIIASGGVASGKDALAKIEAGAAHVQIFSAFAFEGAQIARRIKTQLSVQLMNKGYYNLEEAIGSNHREPTQRLKQAMKRRKRF